METGEEAKARRGTSAVRKGALALGGMVVGSLVGYGVQASLATVGLGEPSVNALIAQQEENFQAVDAKLDSLKGLSATPEMKQAVADLAELVRQQAALSERAGADLKALSAQAAREKDRQLAKTGVAGGADFWLKPGESVNVGDRAHVLVLLGARGVLADISLSGKRQRLTAGDVVEVQAGGKVCKVIFKQALRRADNRIGFDVNCA